MLVPYSHKPTPQFQFHGNCEPSTMRTYGIEDEIDGGHDRALLVEEQDALGMPIYHKTDASLVHNGLEIISHPGTLAFHRYNMRWAELCRLARKHDYDSDGTTTCGLHIHVGRKQLGSTDEERLDTAAKLVLLVDALWDNGLVTFTRRTASGLHWCARPRLTYTGSGEVTMRRDALHAGGQNGPHDSRYTAVNLTNRSTVEIRIFRGTLKRDTIIASIELVDTLCHFAMHHSLTECRAATSFAAVLAYDSYGVGYKELVKECRRLGLLANAS